MFGHAQLLGTVAVLLGLIGYVPYVWDTVRGRTKPHAFSWLIWALLLSLGFGVQFTYGAGPGTWALAAEAIPCGLVFFLALFRGEQDIKPIDWVCLCLAFLGLIFWVYADQPFLALMLIIAVDVLGFIPTVRKAFRKPQEETLLNWFLITISFAVSLLALSSAALDSWIYTAFLFFANAAFTLYLVIRRRQLRL